MINEPNINIIVAITEQIKAITNMISERKRSFTDEDIKAITQLAQSLSKKSIPVPEFIKSSLNNTIEIEKLFISRLSILLNELENLRDVILNYQKTADKPAGKPASTQSLSRVRKKPKTSVKSQRVKSKKLSDSKPVKTKSKEISAPVSPQVNKKRGRPSKSKVLASEPVKSPETAKTPIATVKTTKTPAKGSAIKTIKTKGKTQKASELATSTQRPVVKSKNKKVGATKISTKPQTIAADSAANDKKLVKTTKNRTAIKPQGKKPTLAPASTKASSGDKSVQSTKTRTVKPKRMVVKPTAEVAKKPTEKSAKATTAKKSAAKSLGKVAKPKAKKPQVNTRDKKAAKPASVQNKNTTIKSKYAQWILEALNQLGGSAKSSAVYQQIELKYAAEFVPEMHQISPGSSLPKWKENVKKNVQYLRKLGLLKENSPKGLWELEKK